MTDDWRVKQYYRPRVLIDIAQMLDNPYPGRLVPMSGAEVALVRNLLAYADRRSTFVDEYREQNYLAPTNEQWDDLQAIVSELEAKLMSDCCTDLLDKLDEILTALTAMGVDLENVDQNVGTIAGDWPEALAAWVCACTQATEANDSARVNIVWPITEAPPTYITYDRSDADQTLDPAVHEDACALAQAWFAAGFEFTTERILPAFRFGWDALQQALVAAITIATGGVGIPVAFGVFVTAQLVQELLDLAYDATESDLWNWLVNNKEEIVCALYTEILAGGSTKTIWNTVWSDQIQDNPDLSDGEKLVLKLSLGAIAAATAKVAKEEDTPWYQSVVTPGYCSVCDGASPFTWDWPPCPNGWWSSAVCWDSHLCTNHGKTGNSPGVYLDPPPAGQWTQVTYDLEWTSAYGPGWTVGSVKAFYWNGSTWIEMHSGKSINNTQPAGSLNTAQYVQTGLSEPGGRDVLIQLVGQPGQYVSEPYPLQMYHLTATFGQ